jgi:hypothetical protein
MVLAAFVAPYLLDATTRFVDAAAQVPGTELALITCEPAGRVPRALRGRLAAHWKLDDPLDAGQVIAAVGAIGEHVGPVHRLLGVLEQLQVPLALARERLGIAGMDVATARNFRDKAQMKSVLRAAGVPCARYRLCETPDETVGFAAETGFPLVVKPPAGAGAKSTFRLDDDADLRVWLSAAPPEPGRPALVEEFLTGDEGSFDSVMVDGEIVWYSISVYLPTPLDVLRNPWIQWRVLMPAEIGGSEFDAIRAAGPAALRALGLRTGFTHMEWFSRPDGSVAVSEVAARPAGAQITSMLGYVHDFDFYGAWAALEARGGFQPPPRRWAAGTVFLRGQGIGRVRAVHGLAELAAEVGPLVVESRLPEPGQPSSASYEGDGYIIVRHADTAVVTEAMHRLITGVRVELG